MWSLRLFGTDGGIYMSVEACLALFAFGFGFFSGVFLVRLNDVIRYLESKKSKKQKENFKEKLMKEEVEK